VTAVPSRSGFPDLLKQYRVIICCGSGGVGKTTTAASLALLAAEEGARACVVTIDPARRLADALSVSALTNSPQRLDLDVTGELWAMMLDPKQTFDDLVGRYAKSPDQAERILGNSLYQSLSANLSGTHEYMAMEKLYELHETGSFDCIVVDTPPTRNALDFLDAPRRLTRFLENRFLRVLLMPTRAYLKAVSAATRIFLHTIARVAGTEVVEDAVAFFQAFEGMEQGFHDRAASVDRLISGPDTAFVLVASPRSDTIGEALFFADKLLRAGIPVRGLVANRVLPSFAGTSERREEPDETASYPAREAARRLSQLRSNLAELENASKQQRARLGELEGAIDPGGPFAVVPLFPGAIGDLDGLHQIASELSRS